VAAAFSVLWALLNRGFWDRGFAFNPVWDKVNLGVNELIGADFCAVAVLISFGALLGRVTVSQLMVMALLEVMFYSINEGIFHRLGIVDVGGSMIIHLFGAYFGLACSFMLSRLRMVPVDETSRAASRVHDTLAMLGTLFLFCFFPSFNAALAAQTSMDRAAVNTFLAICSSVVSAYMVNLLIHVDGRIAMEVMQNATIAGGVVMGAVADNVINPYGAMICGFVAGAVATFGYLYLSGILELVGFRDTCGVHNRHGLPGILGGVASAIAAGCRQRGSYRGTMDDVYYQAGRTSQVQAGMQMAGLGIALGIALVTGAITGVVMSLLPGLPAYYEDAVEYVVLESHVVLVSQQPPVVMVGNGANVQQQQMAGGSMAPLGATGTAPGAQTRLVGQEPVPAIMESRREPIA
jgi:ammonium transporter Rh